MRRALGIALLALIAVVPAGASTPSARILFDEQHTSSFDVVALDADATSYANLTPGDQTFYTGDNEGSWSPDGSRIAFTSHRDSNVSTEIYAMDADGSNQRRLTHDGPDGVQNTGGEVFDYAPAWSPAGDAIAYLKSVRGAVDVWTMRPDGSQQTRLTFDGGTKSQLGWSPDGTRVTYELGGSALAVSASGGRPARLAAGVGLAWAPGGTRIAYVTGEGLWVAGPDGVNPTLVTRMPAATPSWSPDGSRIAFVGTRIYPELASKFGAPAREDVYTVRPDGTDLGRLTGPRDLERYSSLPQGGSVPTWWPDGSRLFFESSRAPGEVATTYVMNADGTCEGRFAKTPIQLRRPRWRPGSQPRLGAIQCADVRVFPEPSGGYLGPAALREPSMFRFDLDNDGNQTATGVRVELSSTADIQIVADAGCTGPRLDVVCSLPPLRPGGSATVGFSVSSARAGFFQFTVAVSALEPDTDPSDNLVTLSTQVLPCDRVGTSGDDVIYGTPRRDRICALPGADRVYGGDGDDSLDSGNGADVVAGGRGHDVIDAKGGNDTVYARDGQRDTIDCGTERDVAIVDRFDVVRRCETVARPRRG